MSDPYRPTTTAILYQLVDKVSNLETEVANLETETNIHDGLPPSASKFLSAIGNDIYSSDILTYSGNGALMTNFSITNFDQNNSLLLDRSLLVLNNSNMNTPPASTIDDMRITSNSIYMTQSTNGIQTYSTQITSSADVNNILESIGESSYSRLQGIPNFPNLFLANTSDTAASDFMGGTYSNTYIGFSSNSSPNTINIDNSQGLIQITSSSGVTNVTNTGMQINSAVGSVLISNNNNTAELALDNLTFNNGNNNTIVLDADAKSLALYNGTNSTLLTPTTLQINSGGTGSASMSQGQLVISNNNGGNTALLTPTDLTFNGTSVFQTVTNLNTIYQGSQINGCSFPAYPTNWTQVSANNYIVNITPITVNLTNAYTPVFSSPTGYRAILNTSDTKWNLPASGINNVSTIMLDSYNNSTSQFTISPYIFINTVTDPPTGLTIPITFNISWSTSPDTQATQNA